MFLEAPIAARVGDIHRDERADPENAHVRQSEKEDDPEGVALLQMTVCCDRVGDAEDMEREKGDEWCGDLPVDGHATGAMRFVGHPEARAERIKDALENGEGHRWGEEGIVHFGPEGGAHSEGQP